jgi:hypothetical protein
VHRNQSPAAAQFIRPGSLRWVVRRHGLYFIAPKALTASQPCGLKTRTSEAGLVLSLAADRRGRDTRSPPQLGQRAPSRFSAHEEQNVHSNEQIIAAVESGGRSTLQHSQLGLSCSMNLSDPSEVKAASTPESMNDDVRKEDTR